MLPLLTVQQTCELLQVSRSTLNRMMDEKKLPYIKLHTGSVRFNPEHLTNYLHARTVNKKAIPAIH